MIQLMSFPLKCRFFFSLVGYSILDVRYSRTEPWRLWRFDYKGKRNNYLIYLFYDLSSLLTQD